MADLAAFAPPPYPIRPTGTAAPAFVGRAAERSSAAAAWSAVQAGQRQVVFIGGEPGAGKSRLAAELAAGAYQAGAVVLAATSSPERDGPYQPFAECFRQLLGGTAPGSLAPCLPDSAAELLRLTPLVGRHRAELVAPAPDSGDYRRALFDAVVDVLRAVTELRPVVCVIEDLHWAGQPTLHLLSHVVRHAGTARLLLLCTHRTVAPDRSDDLTYAIADLYPLDGVRRLDLAGLSVDEIAHYLAAEGLTARRSREYAAVLRDHTGGNPFFLRELWRDIGGGLARHSPGERGIRSVMGRPPVSVREMLQRRLSRLSADDRAVLETAGVLGDGGEARVVIQACDADAGAVLAALDSGVQFGFLDGESLARGRIAFPHMLTRQAVLDLASPARRAALHARVAEVLESSVQRSSAMVRQLAYHFAQASVLGYGDTAAGYLRQAAQDAERSLAFEDAADWYTQAAELVSGPDAVREELLFAAADCHIRAWDYERARALYLRLSDSADSHLRLRAAIGYEDACWRPGGLTAGNDAHAMLARAVNAVPEDPGDASYVRALASLGRATALTGDTERSRELAQQALDMARRLGDKRVLMHVLRTMQWQYAEPGTVRRHQEFSAELGRLAKETGDWSALDVAGVFGPVIAYIQADRAAWAAGIADLDLAESADSSLTFMRSCIDQAHAFLDGDFPAAARLAEELVEMIESTGTDDADGQYGLQMYMIRRESGELEQVRPLLGVIMQSSDTWEPGLLALYTELGLADEARNSLWRLLGRADEAAARQLPWALWTAVLVFLVEAAVELGDVPAARRLRPFLAPHSGQQLIAGLLVALFGPADAYLAALDSLLGDAPSADRLFAAALAQATSFDALIHRTSTLTAWAAHLLTASPADPGAWARAAEMIAEARRLAADTGHTRMLRKLDRLDKWSATQPSPATPAPASQAPVAPTSGGPSAAGLTAREVAVLRLLAEGSSNREIAARLRITENTAANHVRSILAKTGAANRTQVAAMALSRGWLES